jgi:hypothetical protein
MTKKNKNLTAAVFFVQEIRMKNIFKKLMLYNLQSTKILSNLLWSAFEINKILKILGAIHNFHNYSLFQ